jgi:hypothetical protein
MRTGEVKTFPATFSYHFYEDFSLNDFGNPSVDFNVNIAGSF